MGFDLSYFGISSIKELPSGWRFDRLDSIAELNPEQIGSDYPYSSILYLDISSVDRGNIADPAYLSLAEAPSRAKRVVRPNDTILSSVRPGNRAFAFLKNPPKNLIVSTGFVVLRPKNNSNCDPRFLYYLTTSDPIINYLASIAEEKSAYPSINSVDLAECVVPIPPLPEQRAIAHILGTLDDKIELNRRMNETLEAMARALFKSWFVDFDPVIDNALAASNPIPDALAQKAARRQALGERRKPLPEEIRRLFPARFVESELGPIPEGWEVTVIGALADVSSGKRPHKKFSEPKEDAEVPLYGGNGPMAYVREPLYEQPILLTGRVGTLGSVFRITSPCWPSDNTLVLVAKGLDYYEFLYFQLHLVDFQALNRGSTQPLLTQSDLKAQPITIPQGDSLIRFHKVAEVLFAKIDANNEQSRTLAAIRYCPN